MTRLEKVQAEFVACIARLTKKKGVSYVIL